MSKLESETDYPLIVADIRAGTVFPAIRDNAADFYYRGNRLCRYNGEFSTDKAFKEASYNYNNAKVKIDAKIIKDRERTRRNDCERTAISELYKYLRPLSRSYILLDIEAGLPQMGKKGTSNFISNTQIDLVFLSKKTKKLVFVEVKRQRDSRVSQRLDGTIEVDAQMKKYKALIEANQDTLRVQYKNQIDFLAKITGDDYSGFALNEVVSAPYLLVYGYDETIEASKNKSLQPRKKGMEALTRIYGNHLIKVKNLAEFDPGVQILEFQ